MGGKPLLRWVWDHLRDVPRLRVYVATDEERVLRAVRSWGGEAFLTPAHLPSGTDRVAYAVRRYHLDARWILNVQADEPLLDSRTLHRFLHEAFTHTDWDLATLTTTFQSVEELRSPHTVKVVVDARGRALYFSRSVIPYDRGGRARLEDYRKHVGVYLYRREALLRLVALAPAPLETVEMLEQLRALTHGMTIRVVHIPGLRLQAVDVPEDVARVEALLRGS